MKRHDVPLIAANRSAGRPFQRIGSVKKRVYVFLRVNAVRQDFKNIVVAQSDFFRTAAGVLNNISRFALSRIELASFAEKTKITEIPQGDAGRGSRRYGNDGLIQLFVIDKQYVGTQFKGFYL